MAASYKKLFKLLIDREMKSKGGNQPGNARKNEKRRCNRIKRRARENLHGTRLHDG